MDMKKIILGLVAGFAAYYLIKRLMTPHATGLIPSEGTFDSNSSSNWPTDSSGNRIYTPMKGFGDEAGVYAYLYDLKSQLENSTGIYSNSVRKIEDLDMKLVKANDEFIAAEAARRPTILFRIAEIQRQRDQAVLEAELILRNVINPLREKLLTEEARLKSAVVAPEIALNWSGKIPAF